MADKTINDLDAIDALAVGDEIAVWDVSGTPATKKATMSQLATLLDGGGGGGGSGKFFASLTPGAASFPTSNYGVLTRINQRFALAFDAATDESVYWEFFIPSTVASTTFGVKVYFVMASATSGAVVWCVAVEAVTPGDSTDLDATTSFGSDNYNGVPGQTVPGTAGYLGVQNLDLSTSNDAAAAGDYLRVRITRDANHASDTASGDAYLLGVRVWEI